jgi:hypothetical protein
VGRLRPKLWIAGHGRILNIWRSEISNRWVIWTAPKGHLAHLGTLKGLKKFFILAFSLTIPYAPRCWYIYLQNRVIFRANVGKLFQHHGSHMGMWLAESINFLDITAKVDSSSELCCRRGPMRHRLLANVGENHKENNRKNHGSCVSIFLTVSWPKNGCFLVPFLP